MTAALLPAAFSTALVMARPTGVTVPLAGAGVLVRVVGAERLCCIQHTGGDDTSETARILAGHRRVGAAHTEHVEHGALRLEDRATAERPDFERRHRHRDLQRATKAGRGVSIFGGYDDKNNKRVGVLACGKEDGGNDVGRVGIESTDRASHGRSDQVLVDVELDERIDVAFEHVLDDVTGDDGLSNDALSTSVNPVNSSSLLICAVVARDGNNAHVLEALGRHDGKGVLDTLGNHVHAHGVTGGGLEADVQVRACERSLHGLEAGKVAGRVEGFLHDGLASIRVEPDLGSTGALKRLKADARPAGHSIAGKHSDSTAARVDSLASTAGTGNQDALSGSHGEEIALSINNKRAGNTNGKGQVANDVLAAGAKDALPVVALVGKLGTLQAVGEVRGGGGAGDDGTTDLDGASKVLERTLKRVTRNLATERHGDHLRVRHLMDTLLGDHLLQLGNGALLNRACRFRGSSLLGLVVGRLRRRRLRGKRNVLAKRQGGRVGIVKLLGASQLLGVDLMVGNVGVLDAPSRGIEEVAIKGNAHGQGNDDPLGKHGILEALQNAANHATADAIVVKVVVLVVELVTGLAGWRGQGVVDRGVLQFVLDRGKNGDDGRALVGLGRLQDVVQAVGGNLEGVDRRGRHNGAEAAGQGSQAGKSARVAEGDGADVDGVDEDETADHEHLELGHVAALHLLAEKGSLLGGFAVVFGPVVALGDVLGNAVADAVILESAAHLDVTLDAVDLELDAQNGSVKGEQEDAVEEENPGSEEAELLETALDARGGAKDEDTNLDGVVFDDVVALLLNGGLDGVLYDVGGRYISLLLGLAVVLLALGFSMLNGVGEHGAGQDDVLLETNGDDEKGQALREQDHGNRDAELGGDEKTKEEGKDGGKEDVGEEPEVGAHAAHGEEQGDKGQVHGQIAKHHDEDVEGFGVLEKVEELGPAVASPLDEAVASVDLGGLHDPLLLLLAVGGLDLVAGGIGNLLGDGKKLGGLGVGDGEGEGAVLGVARQGVGGGGQRSDGQVLGDRDGVGARGGVDGLGRLGLGEDESQEGAVVDVGRDGGVELDILPFPGRVGAGMESSAALGEGGPVGGADADGGIEQALLQQANVRGAGQDGDNDDGVDRMGASKLREELESGRDLLVDPGGDGRLGSGLLAPKASGEKC
ncbi:hypothetical protein CTA1_150 [Colletotrichum tanaceti]|uniref:Uncharacterized protein n=1 Tax=Colletotrichum tanaceti TaxID=1306861 RepID=A0A4U6X2Y7_9PEZI|nr:hypothetical protein CTA1_150 [Colletotrichum tanaceti]